MGGRCYSILRGGREGKATENLRCGGDVRTLAAHGDIGEYLICTSWVRLLAWRRFVAAVGGLLDLPLKNPTIDTRSKQPVRSIKN